MSNRGAEHTLEQEKAAQGQDSLPGEESLLDQAKGQAEASEWISDESITWPSKSTRQGVVDRRQELYDSMRRLESSIARPSGLADWRIDVEAALAELESALEEHVEQTESDAGVFADIVDRAPHLSVDVASLRAEHRELLAACHRALSMSADWSSDALRRRVNRLLARLAIHRQTGAELLYDAYNVDIAAGD
jgi:hypothetical protein